MTKNIDVKKVSLGQKVVAMLDLILGYGTYIGDKRPILIDQPEDNLDSQYIYNNLVSVLRNIKNERQVIIATHNATIVTNAMSFLISKASCYSWNIYPEQSCFLMHLQMHPDMILARETVEAFQSNKDKIIAIVAMVCEDSPRKSTLILLKKNRE